MKTGGRRFESGCLFFFLYFIGSIFERCNYEKITNAENSVTIMRKEDMFMNKKRIMSLISILVPVAIAAIGEFSDQLDAKKQEEEIEDINKRIEALEAKQNEEA